MLHFFDRLEEINVTEKARNDVVSEVDRICEQEIITIIKKAYPRHSILAEESGLDKHQNDYCWVIDPLDGTANYVNGLPHFCISIAVKKGDQLEIGCIYDPIRQELFTAVRGKGAQLNSRRMRVSDATKLENCLVGTGFPFRYPDAMQPYLNTFNAVLPQVSDLRRAGAAALDLAYVACGRLDAYWEPLLKQWDLAAGALMVREAGGVVTDFAETNNFLTNGNVVAGNIKTHAALLALLGK